MDQAWSPDTNQRPKASSSKPPDTWDRPQAWTTKRQAASFKLDKAIDMGYNRIMTSRFQPSGLFRTFKSEKEFHEYVEGHSLPEERRLLWLGFAFGCNFAVNKINKINKDEKKS